MSKSLSLERAFVVKIFHEFFSQMAQTDTLDKLSSNPYILNAKDPLRASDTDTEILEILEPKVFSHEDLHMKACLPL